MVASIFDPFGILAPVVIKAKTLIQNIWKIQVDWDIVRYIKRF